MDEKDDYFRIGEQILTRQMNSMSLPGTEDEDNSINEENQISNNLKNDQLFTKCQLIYHFFLNNEISSFLQPIAQNLKDKVDSETKNLLEILETEGKSPSITNFQSNFTFYSKHDKTAEFFSHLDALNILSFSLLLLRNNEQSDRDSDKKDFTAYYDKLLDKRSDEIVQHEQLKEKYKRLHEKIKEYETVFSMVAKKMNLPDQSDFSTIASELALFNFSGNNNNQNSNNLIFQPPADDKLRQYLINKFNIANESSSDEIISMIEMQLDLLKKKKSEAKNSNDSIKNFFIQIMDMPENSDDNDVKIKIGTILDDIQTKKSEINFLNDKLALQKKQNQETLDELEKLKKSQFSKVSKNKHVSFEQNQDQITIQKEKPIEKEKEIQEEKPDSDIYVLSTEVESLKLTLANAREKIKTIREQNKLLKTISKESINESRAKTDTISELTTKNNELSLRNSELERILAEKQKEINDSKPKYNSEKNLSEAFEFLTSQIETQSNELSQMTESRNDLYKIINKQEKVIDLLDHQILQFKEEDGKKSIPQIADKSDEISLLQKSLVDLADECKRPDILTILAITGEKSPIDPIISAFSALLSKPDENSPQPPSSKEIQDLPYQDDDNISSEKVDFSSFKEVCEYLSSLLVFFDKIANSSETLDWIFSNNYYVNGGEKSMTLNLNPYLNTGKSVMRDTLVNLVQRISYFLEHRKIDFVAPDFLRIIETILPKEEAQLDSAKNQNENENFNLNDDDNIDDENFIKDESSAIQLQRVFVGLTVADILKNYSLHLEEKVEGLSMAVRELKDELVQSEMTSNDAKTLLKSEQHKNMKLMHELEVIESKLRIENARKQQENENENEDETQSQSQSQSQSQTQNDTKSNESTEMFTASENNNNNNNNNNNVTIGLNNDSNAFYLINQAIPKSDSEDDKKKLKKCQKLLKAMKKKFEKILKEQEKKINVLSDRLIDTQNELDSTKEVNDQLSKENKEITETLSIMTERISQFEIEKDAAVTEKAAIIENDYEEKLSNEKNLNKKLLSELDDMKNKLEMAEEAQNIENKNLQKENSDLFSKIEEIRSNYESLIKSYKQKYSEFSEREKKLTDENLIQSESLKKLNKELNEARIENKISALKNKTLTEKIDRQSSLHLTQKTAISANFESKLNESLKMAEIEYEKRKRKFLDQLFEELKDFCDFSKSMNEDNCIKIINGLVNQLKVAKTKENQLNKSTEMLDEMKKELNVSSDNELVTKVLLLSSLSSTNLDSYLANTTKNEKDKEKERYEALEAKISIFDVAVKNWRRWANSMNSILSDNFSSFCLTKDALAATIKSRSLVIDPSIDSELRSKVEEKILSQVGKRRIFRRIEILRNEKVIFLKLLNKYGTLKEVIGNEGKVSLRTVLCVAISIRRIQKISGKLPSLSIGKSTDTSILRNGSNSTASLSQNNNTSYRYSYDENPNYSYTDYYDDNYERSSNSQYHQHKKKPIISCT